MAGSWGCPHEVDERCGKLAHRPCDPGMKGCVLAGRYVFADEAKNRRLREKAGRGEGLSEDDAADGIQAPDA